MGVLKGAGVGALRGAVGAGGRTSRYDRYLAELQAAQGDPETARIISKSYERRSRIRAIGAVATAAVIVLGAGAILKSCHSDTSATVVRQPGVFRVLPVGIDCRALMSTSVVTTAVDRPSTPFDHVPILGDITRPLERSLGTTATFAGVRGKGGGEIDTIVCFRSADVTSSVNKSTGKDTITIPTSSVVTFSAVNEANSGVTIDVGDLQAWRRFEATVVGGFYATPKDQIENGEAALTGIAREVAVDAAATGCATAAWSSIKAAATLAYVGIAQAQYTKDKANGMLLRPFDPATDVSVVFQGAAPDFSAPYTISHGIPVTHSFQGAACKVNSGAFDPASSLNGLFIDPSGNQLPTNLNTIPAPVGAGGRS